MVDRGFLSVKPAPEPLPVLLIPGFMAWDASMTPLAGWLRRRGHEVRGSGMLFNVGCAGRELARLEERLDEFEGRRMIVIGESRGGTQASALYAGQPHL